jgi:hypothetical protein
LRGTRRKAVRLEALETKGKPGRPRIYTLGLKVGVYKR